VYRRLDKEQFMQTRTAWSRRPFARNAAIAACAALFGGGAAFLSDVYFFPFWFDLGWRQPVANWIMAIGLGDAIAAYWNKIWFHMPDWLIATLLGILVGLCVRKTWLVASLCCGLAFVLTRELLFLLVLGQPDPSVWSSPAVAALVYCWRVPSVVLVFLLAFVLSRTLCERQHGIQAEALTGTP
jgi:hypothetical protein